jgi:type IV secretion system protein VirB4
MNDSAGHISELIPWNFITKYAEGVVVQKDGILQRSFAYRGPDIDSSSPVAVNSLCIRVNDFAKRMGPGWAFHMEAQRFFTRDYPRGEFTNLAPYLIDREREEAFRAAGQHFESSYYLTFTWKPPVESVKKLTEMFVQSGSDAEGEAKSIRENVEAFVNDTSNIASLLANDLRLAPLDNEETIAYQRQAGKRKKPTTAPASKKRTPLTPGSKSRLTRRRSVTSQLASWSGTKIWRRQRKRPTW